MPRLVIKQARTRDGLREGKEEGKRSGGFPAPSWPWDFLHLFYFLFYFYYFYHRGAIKLSFLGIEDRKILRDHPFYTPSASCFSQGVAVTVGASMIT